MSKKIHLSFVFSIEFYFKTTKRCSWVNMKALPIFHQYLSIWFRTRLNKNCYCPVGMYEAVIYQSYKSCILHQIILAALQNLCLTPNVKYISNANLANFCGWWTESKNGSCSCTDFKPKFLFNPKDMLGRGVNTLHGPFSLLIWF